MERGLCPYQKNLVNLLLKLHILVIVSNNPTKRKYRVYNRKERGNNPPSSQSSVYVTYIYIQKAQIRKNYMELQGRLPPLDPPLSVRTIN